MLLTKIVVTCDSRNNTEGTYCYSTNKTLALQKQLLTHGTTDDTCRQQEQTAVLHNRVQFDITPIVMWCSATALGLSALFSILNQQFIQFGLVESQVLV